MAKLTRKLKKIFSINSPSDIGVWGSINATTSTDPDVIQSTGYETGVSAAEVSGKKLLPRKDFNGVLYETSYHLAYLYQSGLPEYNAATTYYAGDIVRGDSTSFIYKSLVNDNTGNALNSASWLLCGDLANGLVNDNIADNGDFIITQRGTSFTATTTFTNDDGNYTLDRYKVGNSAGTAGVIDVSQITNPADLPDGARAGISLLHQQADKQAYIAQYYDADITRTLLNKDVSLSFEIYNADSVTRNFRAAILTWQGTADDMPNDPVSTWQTAANLGFATNFTTENTTTALTANATSWNRFTINGVNIDTANTNNLAIIIWTDEEMPNAYEWRATKVKLEQSSIATAWKARSVAEEENNIFKRTQIVVGGYAGGGATGIAQGGFVATHTPLDSVTDVIWLENISSLGFGTNEVGSDADSGYYINATGNGIWYFRRATVTQQNTRFHDKFLILNEL